MKENFFIHIIVLGYGQFTTTTQRCIESLLIELDRHDVCITVIDNSSPDRSAELQSEYLRKYPKIKGVYLNENLGFAGGMNFGASIKESTWLLLMGSDTIFTDGSFDILYRTLVNLPPKISIVGPVTNEAGTSQKLDLKGSNPSEILAQFKKIFPSNSNLITPLYRADFFCVAIRKVVWDQLRGLDLSYGKGYYEDFDFSLRAKEIGHDIVMLEDVLVFHSGSSSFKLDPKQKSLIKGNKNKFIKKFPNAELRHRREDNIQVLYYYLSSKNLLNTAINKKISFRMIMAKNDFPKSFWKKLFWKMKLNKIEKEIHLLLNNTLQACLIVNMIISWLID